MNIAIIYGGRSGEHEISLISAAAVTRGIKKEHSVILIGITKEGKWYLQDKAEYERIINDSSAALSIKEDPANLIRICPGSKEASFVTEKQALKIDVVFPVLHGTYGEDGTIQGLSEMSDIPFVGCPDLNDSGRYDEIFQRCIDELGFPLFVKPCCAGSSNGANKATNPKEFSYALMSAFSWDDKVLVEKSINAREIECSVTGNSTTAAPDHEEETV